MKKRRLRAKYRKLRRRLPVGITTRPAGHGETTVYSYGERLGEVKGSTWTSGYGAGSHRVKGGHRAAIRALVRETTGRTT